VWVFVIFCNTFISSYFGWYFLLCIFRPPTVSRCVFGGADVLSVGRESGSAGPQFNNCAKGSLCGPRDPEGSQWLRHSYNDINTDIKINWSFCTAWRCTADATDETAPICAWKYLQKATFAFLFNANFISSHTKVQMFHVYLTFALLRLLYFVKLFSKLQH